MKSLLFLLFLTLLSISIASSDATKPKSRYAWVSFLYGTSYFTTLRVMQASVRRSGTPHDIVTLVDEDVGPSYRKRLQEDGVIVLDIPKRIENSYAGDAVFQSRFGAVMSKLNMFNMTQYEKIIYMDADTMMIDQFHKNNDVLFECGDFCAVFINPCIFNSGVMVIKPNSDLFADMISKIDKLESYDGADQGFLNSYFNDLLSAPMFDPSKVGTEKLKGSFRLPTTFHVDHFLFYQRAKWDMPCLRPRILEFMGPAFLKPWNWWTYVILDLSWEWLSLKNNLPGGDPEWIYFTGYLAFTAAVYMIFRIIFKSKTSGALSRKLQSKRPSESLQTMQCLIVGFSILVLCLYSVFRLINPSTHPTYAIIIFLIWSHCLAPILYVQFCRLNFEPTTTHGGPSRAAIGVRRRTFIFALLPSVCLLFFSTLWSMLNMMFLFTKVAFLVVAILAQIGSFFVFFGWTAALWMQTYHYSAKETSVLTTTNTWISNGAISGCMEHSKNLKG
ncbi:hypothetical protein PROFUN_03641 [Planoprotostelium fungivorum]|uniref:Uncharacterized protein n=1 Tax=Planoprotostelium fungivorum TaxID=1890364 RepID=A0A2P6NSF0_9EUKA|nr:hypothetical protein PROFUN_03641 [Planoprotostelium fungivorum]